MNLIVGLLSKYFMQYAFEGVMLLLNKFIDYISEEIFNYQQKNIEKELEAARNLVRSTNLSDRLQGIKRYEAVINNM